MHLERLEISGFKSFSDRSELAFDRGVTAIVGPNGCGKSNVADALTWVLGEQSAKSLRGDKMEDVIFSGSDARKPTGAAEVRLRFGNVIVPPSLRKEMGEEVEVNGNGHHGGVAELIEATTREVEVTRRLFRSGESEYLIDGQTCRLKDIHELLMDTGLGAKAYAIIEQGKIGMILSSRPDRSASADRRGRGDHQVQGAPPLRRAQARSGAAEPHAPGRHRLRARQATRLVEAASRQGAALYALARRDAALGESAVRAALSQPVGSH